MSGVAKNISFRIVTPGIIFSLCISESRVNNGYTQVQICHGGQWHRNVTFVSWITTNGAVCHGEGCFSPSTRWPPYGHGERSRNAREHVRGISQTCRYPYWFRGCVVADLFHWLFLSSISRGTLLSRGLKMKKIDGLFSFLSRDFELHRANYLLMPLFYWLFWGSVKTKAKAETRSGVGCSTVSGIWNFMRRQSAREEQRAKITFNRFILKLRFTAKPRRNRGKSIYPHSHFPPCHIYGAVSALVYRTVVDNVEDAALHMGHVQSVTNWPYRLNICTTLAGVNFHAATVRIWSLCVRSWQRGDSDEVYFSASCSSELVEITHRFQCPFCAPIPFHHPARKARRSLVIPSVGSPSLSKVRASAYSSGGGSYQIAEHGLKR